MSDRNMLQMSKEFAVLIVKLCNKISEDNKEYVLTKQLLKSGTSIGANIHESKYAQSTADFVSKMQIALKECYETEYWLEILNQTNYIADEDVKTYMSKCGSIRRMLISAINTSKEKLL